MVLPISFRIAVWLEAGVVGVRHIESQGSVGERVAQAALSFLREIMCGWRGI